MPTWLTPFLNQFDASRLTLLDRTKRLLQHQPCRNPLQLLVDGLDHLWRRLVFSSDFDTDSELQFQANCRFLDISEMIGQVLNLGRSDVGFREERARWLGLRLRLRMRGCGEFQPYGS